MCWSNSPLLWCRLILMNAITFCIRVHTFIFYFSDQISDRKKQTTTPTSSRCIRLKRSLHVTSVNSCSGRIQLLFWLILHWWSQNMIRCETLDHKSFFETGRRWTPHTVLGWQIITCYCTDSKIDFQTFLIFKIWKEQRDILHFSLQSVHFSSAALQKVLFFCF